MDMDFVGAFELECGRMVEFSRIIVKQTCTGVVRILHGKSRVEWTWVSSRSRQVLYLCITNLN